MQQGRMLCLAGAGLLAALANAGAATPPQGAARAEARAIETAPTLERQALAAELRALKQELAEQRALLRRLRAELDGTAPPPRAAPLAAQPATPPSRSPAAPVVPAKAVAHAEDPAVAAIDSQSNDAPLLTASLAEAHGTGNGSGTAAASAATAAAAAAPPAPAPAPQPVAANQKAGVPPRRAPEVAPLFEQPGVLTPRGKYVLEPGLQFGYSSSNRVALVGYSIIPSLLIGLVDVREVKRNTTTFALTGRMGVTNRLEVEARIPYVYRSDSTVSRELFTGTAVERVFHTSGRDLGDVELAARYQLNDGGADSPYYVAGLRYKMRTGRDPFEVVTDCLRRCVGDNVTGTGLPLELPTGSGFHALQPSLTVLMPSDPAVLFGSISYLHNFKRNAVQRTVLGGEKEMLGEVDPGGVFGFNFGLGIALNDKLTLSFGYDHNSIERMRQGGAPVPGAVRTQLGTLLVGFGYRQSARRSINVAVGAGLTRDTPDVTLTVRVPTTF